MSLDPFVLELLVDPVDHGALLYVPSNEVLYNPRRHCAFAVRESIAVMLETESLPVSAAEGARYEADPEGRWSGPTGTNESP